MYSEYGFIFKNTWKCDWLWFGINYLDLLVGKDRKKYAIIISLNCNFYNDYKIFKKESFYGVYNELGDPLKSFGILEDSVPYSYVKGYFIGNLTLKNNIQNYQFFLAKRNYFKNLNLRNLFIKFYRKYFMDSSSYLLDKTFLKDQKVVYYEEFPKFYLFLGIFTDCVYNTSITKVIRFNKRFFPLKKDSNFFLDGDCYSPDIGLLETLEYKRSLDNYFINIKKKGLILNKKSF